MKATTELANENRVEIEYWQGEPSRLHEEWRREDGGFDFGGRFTLVWTDERKIPAGGTAGRLAEHLWVTHNMGDRPRGREIRSMSAGDVLVLTICYGDGTRETLILRAAPMGFEQVLPGRWLNAKKQSAAEAEDRLERLDRALRGESDENVADLRETYRLGTLEHKPSYPAARQA